MRRWAQVSQRSTCPPNAAVRQRSIADIAYLNKAIVYDLLLKTAAETLITIAADPKHLGARIGLTAVLHTWGSALTHHPHAHIIVPGGGLSRDGKRWIACRPGFFLSVRVLSRLFRRLFLERLTAAYQAGRLEFSLPSRTAGVLRRPGRPGRAGSFQSPPRRTAEGRMGGLCQAAFRRTRRCARLPVPLHAPDRYCQ